ncbi:Aste57867_20409 [Aphanomyces stellatus]|uniref:Aste57867_20409 protein n=1 Tax=Aphanomyces stellatus TaxID=120398 RepID=A0A485LG50_9STRA|nr:hypothetical protein As57867_020343 [Aphanomyces stellatus]VFT97095.1 Aste57867_20409 [Aphanomyces stellatus]
MVTLVRGAVAFLVATAATALVQFNNEIALHLQSQQTHSPWHAVYFQAPENVLTMDIDGRGGSSFLHSAAPPPVAAAATPPAVVLPRCNQFPVVNGPCSVQVLFAVSKCLDTSMILLYSEWVQKLASAERKFFTGGKTCDVVFSTVILTECAPATPPSRYLLSELSDTDIAAYFTPFGNVYCSMAELGRNQTALAPAAVVSLFADKVSHDVISAYEEDQGVFTIFNFHAAHAAFAQDSILLAQETDLFMHNPFKEVQSFHCAKSLPNGLPVVYVDGAGARQCFCQCPSGYEETTRHGQRLCVPSPKENCACYWSGRQYEYDIVRAQDARSAANTCRVGDLYPATISRIPYPRSNYVSLSRTNEGDVASGATNVEDGTPLVQVQVTQVLPRVAPAVSPIVLERNYPWSYFAAHRDNITNQIALDKPGVYAIKMTAQGYRSATDCEVCLAVVDKFRPTSAVACPKPLCDQATCLDSTAVLQPTAVAEYTAKNLLAATAVLAAHAAYSSDKNVVNDVCGEGRCDEKRFLRKAMFESAYVVDKAFEGAASTCFAEKVNADVIAQLQQSPFGADLGAINVALPVPAGQCTRCCKLETKLKEFSTKYACGNASVAEKTCSGTDPGCVTEQCLVGLGPTFFTASAAVAAEYQASTDELLHQLYPGKGYQSSTEVHLQLECSAFGKTDEGKCGHVAALQSMFAVASSLNDRTILVDDKAYVFWRVRVDGGDWRSWTDKQPVGFYAAHATIALEGWSQCGLVKKFIFHVYLHLNQRILVNDEFDGMWYQSTSASDATAGALCNYFQSDFAELTFDFNPMAGLIVNGTALPYVSTGVACAVQYATTRTPAPLFASTARNASLIRRTSFQMQSIPTTRADTTFTVACNFSYLALAFANRTVTLPASKTFTIKNCDKPDWDCPFGACADKCAAAASATAYPVSANQFVAPFNVCQGRTVFANAAEATVVADDKKTCCAFCGAAECQPLLGHKDSEDVFRCVVTEPKLDAADAQLLIDDEEQGHDDVVLSTALVAFACAFMVTGVLLVALQRRAAVPEEMFFDDDPSYYPLLDR